jgi:hypothetical protein
MKALIVPDNIIKDKIYTIRGLQVMIDKDLAELYGVSTKRLNEQVKRNKGRFPSRFMFQLSDVEKDELVAKCDRLSSLKHSSTNPYSFTEQGVSMLASVLKSKKAVSISIQIIDAFVVMRKFLTNNAYIFQRLDKVELKQLAYDKNFDKVFKALETHEPKQGIFYDGQIFDAYKFVSSLIRSAKKSIVLIDNYVDESILTLFSKRKKDVNVVIYMKNPTKQLNLDVKKFNSQYEPIEVKIFKNSHDRFLIIDKKDIYHFGASLKDLGKKWFAFSRFEKGAVGMLRKLES